MMPLLILRFSMSMRQLREFEQNQSSHRLNLRTTADQFEQADEQGRADDGPDDRKGAVPDLNVQNFSNSQGPGEPGPQEGSDQSQHDRDEATAMRITGNCLSEAAAHAGNDQ